MTGAAESPLTGLEAPWTVGEVRTVVSRLLVDLERFLSEPGFRRRVTERLPTALPTGADPELRDAILQTLYAEVGGFAFEDSEQIETAWSAVPRSSADRRAEVRSSRLRFADDYAPIAASIYSFPSPFVDVDDARSLLRGVRRIAPDREFLALVDLPMRRELAAAAERLDVTLLDTYGRSYTPWPRDPFSVGVERDGGLFLVERDAPQRTRETDATMGQEIVQNLPPSLDDAWGEVGWGRADQFFHNGHILTTERALWISIHALEIEILERLDRERVPVASFATVDGVVRYLEAARTAASELGALFGRPVRFVHPLPESGAAAERQATMRILGGGAGFDLDSVVTLIPDDDGELTAVVGDPSAVDDLVAEAPLADWTSLRDLYRLAPPAAALPRLLTDHHRQRHATRLDGFLDFVAEHLGASGLAVTRLPLLLVPTAIVDGGAHLEHDQFIVGWHNVVFEPHGAELRAEGFTSGLPAGDEWATEAFEAAGVALELLPALPESVIRNGGYRCASNQVRRIED